ncbi:MAG: DUF1846 domain-containing protein [Clostridia bacterium]|nr:DUF1846 domain-containing protein [Clostridia bacterium]MBQ2518268.1 DUF1846 domain-containing protein [Clostridia bacterium]MBQ4341390.1 DUF1846 domain-containing protein [Clostridia bacterium]MBR6428380.1 DUF1846 domain-containing protein [Clostridia bacterium]
MKIGFDNEKYISMQSKKILERIARFGDKLYLEFGGKLFDDYHASRVVPGFLPDTKINMLSELRDSAEIILAIHAGDIEHNKIRSDIDIAYDREVLRLIDAFRGRGLTVSGVVITRYREGQPAVDSFADRLRRLGVRVYRHYPIEDYPKNPKFIVSDEGFGRNEFIETTRPLVVVTAPGPGSGKLAVCLSQVYQEFRRGVRAGYAKFETFPVWNLPLSHPVNLAYEAATTDLDDMNMIDPFHLEAYGVSTVNYNRDVESFPVLNTMFTHIYGESPYKSPTDMGVNMIGNCITDDEVVCAAAKQEIIRRYYAAACAYKRGRIDKEQVYKAEFIMTRAGITTQNRPVVAAALARAEETGNAAMAIELPDGAMITGKTGEFVGPAAGALLNALKALAGINRSIDLLSPVVLEPIRSLKINHFGSENPLLHSDEVLYALSISAATNPTAALALKQLPKLRGCEAHSSVMLSAADRSVYRKLGLNCTSEPNRNGNRLYM